jgi:hypothetical protein
LLGSVVYRMRVLATEVVAVDRTYITWTDQVAIHVDANGTLSSATNPEDRGDYTHYTAGSLEGESFGVFSLDAAYRDWGCE